MFASHLVRRRRRSPGSATRIVLLGALGAVLAAPMFIALPASAEPDAPVDVVEETNQLLIDVTLNKDGRVSVKETLTWDKDALDSAPIQRELLTFLPYTSTQWRKFEYSNFGVESEQEDLTFQVLDDTKNIAVKIMRAPVSPSTPTTESSSAGEEEEVPERTTATLSYDIEGSLAALTTITGSRDEFYWGALSPTGHAFDAVSLTVHSPTAPVTADCTVLTPGSLDLSALEDLSQEDTPEEAPDATTDAACATSALRPDAVTFEGENLSEYRGISVRIDYPARTFDSSSAILIKDPDPDGTATEGDGTLENDPTLTDSIDQGIEATSRNTLPIMAGVLAAILGAFAVYFGRRRSDATFAGLATGDVTEAFARTAAARESAGKMSTSVATRLGLPLPIPGTTRVTKKFPETLRFEPPADLTVGEAGAVLSLDLQWREATATLFDLASRGFFTVSVDLDDRHALPRDTGSASPLSWTLTRAAGAELDSTKLTRHERRLLQVLFEEATSVTVSTLHSHFAPQVLEVLSELGREFSGRGLTRGDLDHAANGRAHRKRRTPIGRAYAEQAHAYAQALRIDPDLAAFSLTAGVQSDPADPTAKMAKTDQSPQPGKATPDANLFYAHLPYAVVFDAEREWAAAFDSAKVDFELPSWIAVSEQVHVASAAKDRASEPFGWFVGLISKLGH